jgi:hypothetical protein
MQMVQKRALPISSAQTQRPIEFLTENGFSIIRLSDIDKSISPVGPVHEFLVRDPYGYELNITVHISNDAVTEIGRRSRVRISNVSSYWIAMAERHLATYLWEVDDYPPDASLTVDELTIDDTDLARRWKHVT